MIVNSIIIIIIIAPLAVVHHRRIRIASAVPNWDNSRRGESYDAIMGNVGSGYNVVEP